MSSESLLAFALAVLIFSLKIGPNITAAMSYSIASGVRGLIPYLLGFYVALSIYLVIVFIGLDALNIDIVFVAILIKSLAAVFLIWIGIKGLKNEDLGTPLEDESPQKFFDYFTGAFILTLSNPLVIVFYASIIPVFFDHESLTLDSKFVLGGLILLLDSVGAIVYCTPLILFRKKLPKSFVIHVKTLSSIIIILIGLYIGYTAIGAADVLKVGN
jgi:threonine/homoserine/homoserine lactone efflux protein